MCYTDIRTLLVWLLYIHYHYLPLFSPYSQEVSQPRAMNPNYRWVYWVLEKEHWHVKTTQPANPGPAPPHVASASLFGGQFIREHIPPTEMAQISTRLPRSISPKSPPDPHNYRLCTHPVPTWNVIFGRWSSVCRLPKTYRCFLFAGCGREGRLGQWQVHLIKERMCQVSQLPTLTEIDTGYTEPNNTQIFLAYSWQGSHRSSHSHTQTQQ